MRHASAAIAFSLLLALILSAPVAQAEVRKVFNGASGATGDTGELSDISSKGFSVQLCGGAGGSAFSGSFVVKQGMESGKLVQTYSSGAIAGLAGCSATYYIQGFAASPYAQIIVTRSAGTYSVWIRGN